MTSHEFSLNGLNRSCLDPRDGTKMREFRRPTLCVIDENGTEVPHPYSAETGSDVINNFENLSIRDHNANVTKCESGETQQDSDKDLLELKATTTRLRLSTRRQSTVAWQQQYLNTPKNPVKPSFCNDNLINKDETFTEERKTRINEALAWLRNELQEMRSQDEILARTLLSIRHEIHQLKLQRSCKEHQDMLDDVTMDMEENSQLLEISDMPITDSVNDTPLKHLGVTRMHLSARRFSTC